eukprot:1189367-Prorocentrum_minimum.AAC.1
MRGGASNGPNLPERGKARGVDSATRGVDSATRGVDSVTRGVDSATRGVDLVTRGVDSATRGAAEKGAHAVSVARGFECGNVDQVGEVRATHPGGAARDNVQVHLLAPRHPLEVTLQNLPPPLHVRVWHHHLHSRSNITSPHRLLVLAGPCYLQRAFAQLPRLSQLSERCSRPRHMSPAIRGLTYNAYNIKLGSTYM